MSPKAVFSSPSPPNFSRPTSFFSPSNLPPHKELEIKFSQKLFVRTFLTFEDKIEDEKDPQTKVFFLFFSFSLFLFFSFSLFLFFSFSLFLFFSFSLFSFHFVSFFLNFFLPAFFFFFFFFFF